MNNKSTKTNTSQTLTDRRKNFITGVLLSIVLIATPFLFYTYKIAPKDSMEWDTIFGVIRAGNYRNVQFFMHSLLTKSTFVLITGMWFLTSKNWWKYAILVPFTMYLFQLVGVLNHKLKYIDEFDFWYSLPVIIPILLFLVYISIQLNSNKSDSTDLMGEVEDEIKKIMSDDL